MVVIDARELGRALLVGATGTLFAGCAEGSGAPLDLGQRALALEASAAGEARVHPLRPRPGESGARWRERQSCLQGLAQVMALESTGAPEADASGPGTAEAPFDAGAFAGSEPAEGPEPADAQPAEPAAAESDAGAQPAEPPAPSPLPLDIVATSELPLHGMAGDEQLSARQVWQLIARQEAICFGELHNDPYHHNAQLRALARWLDRVVPARRRGPAHRGRFRERPEQAVGFEMFQRPFQEPLSAFVRGELGEEDFLQATQYATRWGYDFSLYRPQLELTAERGKSALALNARTELTRQIGREGLESLTEEQAAEVPELDLTDQEHREYIFSLFGITPAHPAAASLENIYTAQTVWDETMAQTAADWARPAEGPARSVFTLAGVAHCHRSAIPRRFGRRTGAPMLSVAAVHAAELEGFPEFWVGYDLLVVLEPPTAQP